MADSKPTAKTERMVLIDRIDHKGNGQSFRFFTKSATGVVLTAKIDESVSGYSEGMSVPASKLSLLAVANEKQLARYNSGRSGSVDVALLA